ncbi:MAG: hypothetical protein KTR31_16035 [Myxococcales bacterium]|nr:hypothetical protein [Myxococcales bacterium]
MPKAVSVTQDGQEDGWQPELGWFPEITPQGDTRLTVSAGSDVLPAVHKALAAALAEPLSVLYRQKVDRQDPKPQGHPPKDFVAVGLPCERVTAALTAAGELVYTDARCEVWLRGGLGEQIVLDHDGVIYVYPDDPAFRDALGGCDVPEADVDLISDRDYVKHWFHAHCDAMEEAFLADLGLSQVPHRKG